MHRTLFRVVVTLALFCGLAWAAQRPGGFRVLGPGGGGAMFNPTISPHDPNTVLISCDMTGSYITHDGGRSWRMFNLRGVTRFFVFDPLAPHTIYAEGIGLWRSTDDGQSWKLVYPKPSAVQGVEMSSDHAEETIFAQPNPLGTIAALAIDPADSRTLYAAAGKKDTPALFVSRDYGESWQKEVALPEAPQHLWVDPYSPHTSRTLILVGAHFVVTKSSAGIRKAECAGHSTHDGLDRRLRRPWQVRPLHYFRKRRFRFHGPRRFVACHHVIGHWRQGACHRHKSASSGVGLHFLQSPESRWQDLARSCDDCRWRTHVEVGMERKCGRRTQRARRVDYADLGDRLG